MKSFISIACLLIAVSVVASEARLKRSVILTSPVLAHTVPVAAAVVHSNPTTVVKTEQVHSGDQSSYSYSSEVKSVPTATVVRTAAVAAAPVVSTVHTVPTYATYAQYAYPYAHYAYPYTYAAGYSPYYSPYYVLGKK